MGSSKIAVALAFGVVAGCAGIGPRAGDQGAGAGPPAYAPRQVRLVQRALGEQGYPAGAPGVYDERTRTAVAAFQRSHGLEATGELSGATARALGLAPADVLPARGQGELQDEIQYHAWTDGGG